MAVVTRYGSAVKDPTSLTQDRIPAEESQGRSHSCKSTLEVVATDNATSVLLLASLPSSVRIHPTSKLYADAIAGFTSAKIGVAGALAGLMAITDIHAGGNFNLAGAVDISLYNAPLWKQVGLAADPGGKLDILLTIGADLGGAGTITADIGFSTP